MLSVLAAVAVACVGCGAAAEERPAATTQVRVFGRFDQQTPKQREFAIAGRSLHLRVPLPTGATRPDTVTYPPPDTVPSYLDDPSNFQKDVDGGLPYARHHLLLLFNLDATAAQRTAAIAAASGAVVGGYRFGNGDGYYVLRLPFDSSAATLDSARALLRRQPGVRYSGKIYALPASPASRPSRAQEHSAPCNLAIVSRQIPNCILVTFRADATTAQRVAAVAQVNGTIDKDKSLEDPHGIWFLVGVPEDSTWATVDSAVVELRQMPGVRNADRYFAFQLGGGEPASSIESPLKLFPCARCESDAHLMLQDVRVPAPDSVPVAVLKAFRADSNITHDDAPEQAGYFPRNIVLVRFLPSATRTQRSELLRIVRGKVLGGFPIGIGGMYYVQIEGARTTEHLFRAIAFLKASPLVKRAIVDALDVIHPAPARE